MERTLQGVFQAAGMKLIVQNAGEVSGIFYTSKFYKQAVKGMSSTQEIHMKQCYMTREKDVATLTKTKFSA